MVSSKTVHDQPSELELEREGDERLDAKSVHLRAQGVINKRLTQKLSAFGLTNGGLQGPSVTLSPFLTACF